MTGALLPGEPEYVAGDVSFLAGLRPQDGLSQPLERMLGLLRQRWGTRVDIALSDEAVDLEAPLSALPPEVRSPRAGDADSSWLRHTNMSGVNVRTVGDYGGVIKYAMTLPSAIDSLHLLPIWEPGVVSSLYGIASWNFNTEFFSDELYAASPNLDSVARQLRAISNLLHVMGKTVGMDVIPHTDRFSEAALGTPDLFEWMRVTDRQIVDHSDALNNEVEEVVFEWLTRQRPANGSLTVPADAAALFSLDESTRLRLLFGDEHDRFGRIDRRVGLLAHLKAQGLEPVPATMGVPFRGIAVDPDPAHSTTDERGLDWPDYVITRPEFMSRVFSPLARFKFYERVDDNANWEIDFNRPRRHVWEYVCRHYAETQHIGNFDFMRGDMSHVQMRPDGVPDDIDEFYDILGSVKTHIQTESGVSWFGYFAETFLPARDVFQFGEELDHLEASLADATLGDLQATVVGDNEFLRRFRRYLDDLETRQVAPAFTIMTADKDDPRFDEFYRAGNEARQFTAVFLPDMPSYVGLGFEIRDVHHEPVENERYTKLFVFKEEGDSNVYPSKARFFDEFIWGENDELFRRITSLRTYAERVLDEIGHTPTRWLIPPDATTLRGTAVWTQQGEPRYVFVVNYDTANASGYFGIPALGAEIELHEEYSTVGAVDEADRVLTHNDFFHRLENLWPGEGRVYRVSQPLQEDTA